MTLPPRRRPSNIRIAPLLIGAALVVGLGALVVARFTLRPQGRSTPVAVAPQAPQVVPAPPAAPRAPEAASALSVLLQQARFWRDQHNIPQALESLDRAERLAPGNLEVEGLRAELEGRGNPSPFTAAPPPNLPEKQSVESYLARARNGDGYEVVKSELERLTERDPTDMSLQLAYAEVLALRESKRAEAIARLSALARLPAVSAPATQAWRQTLLMLPPGPDAAPPLQNYLAGHPDDAEIAARLAEARAPGTAPTQLAQAKPPPAAPPPAAPPPAPPMQAAPPAVPPTAASKPAEPAPRERAAPAPPASTVPSTPAAPATREAATPPPALRQGNGTRSAVPAPPHAEPAVAAEHAPPRLERETPGPVGRGPHETLAISLSLLHRDPGDADARRAAIAAALELDDRAQAEILVQEGLHLAPNDPESWLAAADLARADNNAAEALRDLAQARDLRRQQMGADAETSPASPRPLFGTQPGSASAQAAAVPSSDRFIQQIDREVAAIVEPMPPHVQTGFAVRNRSGTGGDDHLTELTLPLEATYAADGIGRLRLAVVPTRLNGVGGSANGVGLDIAYPWRGVTADIGASPLGFREQNLLGGASFATNLTDNLKLRLTGERRLVGDSLLSQAGASDPRTGARFGGVVRDHAQARLSYSNGTAELYLMGGGALLTGDHVLGNGEREAGLGGDVLVYQGASEALRMGVDLTYFGYDHNLRYATLGQGGYFSPQWYLAAMLPVTFAGQVDDDLAYDLGASLGFERYHEDASPLYPLDPGLGTGSNAALVRSGFAGGAHAALDWRVAPNLHLGGQLAFQHTTHFDEQAGTVYARYLFDRDGK